MLFRQDVNSWPSESIGVRSKSPLDLSVESPPLQLNSPPLDNQYLDRLPRSYRSDDDATNWTTRERLPCSPTYSIISSSFSQRWSIDSGSTVSTASTVPSTPRTPPPGEQDPIDTLELEYAPRIGIFKRHHDSSSGPVKRLKLPGPHSLLERMEPRPGSCSLPSSLENLHLRTAVTSPELSDNSVYPRERSNVSCEDPIIRRLNILRRERSKDRSLLECPDGLARVSLDIAIGFSQRPVHFQSAPSLPSVSFDVCWSERRRPPLEDKPKKERAKADEDAHCNTKYTVEESDFIRYNKHDAKLSWPKNLNAFNARFPMRDRPQGREKQGIQGVYYRENSNIPEIEGDNQLVFLPNGHVRGISIKVRQQGDYSWACGLVDLYPERALTYDWVSPEHKDRAAMYSRIRIIQKERAKCKAQEEGTWVEYNDKHDCNCCRKDEDRNTSKRWSPAAIPNATPMTEGNTRQPPKPLPRLLAKM